MNAVLHSPGSYPWVLGAFGAAIASVAWAVAEIRVGRGRLIAAVVAGALLLFSFKFAPRFGVNAPAVLYLVAISPLAWVDAERSQLPFPPALLALAAGVAMFGPGALGRVAPIAFALAAAFVLAAQFRWIRDGIGSGDVLLCVSLVVVAPSVTAAVVVACAGLVARLVQVRAGSVFTFAFVLVGLVAFVVTPSGWNYAPSPLAMVAR